MNLMIYWNKCCGYLLRIYGLSKREMQFSDTQCSDKPFWASYYRILVQSNTICFSVPYDLDLCGKHTRSYWTMLWS